MDNINYATPVKFGRDNYKWKVGDEYFLRTNIRGAVTSKDGTFTVDFQTGEIRRTKNNMAPIKLKEILHRLSSENKEGLTEVDNWKITDYDFMTDMGFKPDGMYHFALKSPHIKVCHKKGVGFVVEDYSKTNKPDTNRTDVYDKPPEEDKAAHKTVFPTFKELTDHFTGYEQKWEHEPYKS